MLSLSPPRPIPTTSRYYTLMRPTTGVLDTLVVAGGAAGVENGTASPSAESASVVPGPSSAPPPEHRITVADQAKLAAYFKDNNWPLNKNLPTESTSNMGNPIIVLYLSLGLKHSQTARYLAKWKDDVLLLGGQIRPNMTPEEIRERIMANVSHTPIDFVTNALKTMVEDASAADTEADKYCKQFVEENHDWKPLINNLIAEAEVLEEESTHVMILVGFFDSIVQSLAELVPKKASCISKAELAYDRRIQQHREEAVSSWLKLWETEMLPSAPDQNEDCWRSAVVTVLYSIYALFQVSHANDDKPPIEIPGRILVSKWALPVVYYSASFTMLRCKLAKSIGEEKKEVYQSFAVAHSLTKEEAEKAELPTSMVEQREKHQGNSSFARCSRAYFDFMQVVESTFLHNLNLKMMVAYDRGDLIIEIGDALLASNEIRAKFDELVEEAGIEDDDLRKEIFEYVINLFTGMRGRWFIKTVRGQESVQSIFSKAATRKKVANASDVSKARAEGSGTSGAEKEVYDEAAKNVLDSASNSADDEIEEAMEARVDDETAQ